MIERRFKTTTTVYEVLDALENISERCCEHVLSWSFACFTSLFAYFWYFFMIILPTRSWMITPFDNGQPMKATSRLCKCAQYSVLLRAPLFGLAAFCAYHCAFVFLENTAQPLAEFYHGATEDLPVYALPLLLPLILSFFRINDFLKLSFSTCCTMYIYVATLTFVCGFINTLLFTFIYLLSLHVTYGRTSAGIRWFFKIFTFCFLQKALAKAVSIYYLGTLLPVTSAALHLCVSAIYLYVAAVIQGKAGQPLLMHDGYHERFFQRGNEQAQMQYIKQQGLMFMFVTATAAICTFGQFGPASTYAPETMANVYCKGLPANEIQCLVNVTYYDPTKSETEELGIEDSSDWDFCGSLLYSLDKLPRGSGRQKCPYHTLGRDMARRASARHISTRPCPR